MSFNIKQSFLNFVCFLGGCWPERTIDKYKISEAILTVKVINGLSYQVSPYWRKIIAVKYKCGRCGRITVSNIAEERTLTEDERQEHNI